jgi:hypothetical protein
MATDKPWDRRFKHPDDARTKFERWICENGGTRALSIAIGVHQLTVTNWTSRRTRPTLEQTVKIIEASKGVISAADILEATRAW